MQGEEMEGGSLHGVFSTFGKAMEFVENNFDEYDLTKNVATRPWEREWKDGCDWLKIRSVEVQ